LKFVCIEIEFRREKGNIRKVDMSPRILVVDDEESIVKLVFI